MMQSAIRKSKAGTWGRRIRNAGAVLWGEGGLNSRGPEPLMYFCELTSWLSDTFIFQSQIKYGLVPTGQSLWEIYSQPGFPGAPFCGLPQTRPALYLSFRVLTTGFSHTSVYVIMWWMYFLESPGGKLCLFWTVAVLAIMGPVCWMNEWMESKKTIFHKPHL